MPEMRRNSYDDLRCPGRGRHGVEGRKTMKQGDRVIAATGSRRWARRGSVIMVYRDVDLIVIALDDGKRIIWPSESVFREDSKDTDRGGTEPPPQDQG